MTSRRRRTRTSLTSVLVVLALAGGGYALRSAATESISTTAPSASASASASAYATSSPSGGTSADPHATATARAQLAALPVKGPAPTTGYDRVGDFGTAWLDVDHNGCDTRNDILARDLTAVVRRGPCTVMTGTLVSPYTGATIDFVRGNSTSTLVQIDHVVALENAWRTGAQQLSQAQREALANDPENLFAVDQHSNAQKRSGDAATWLPADKSFRCTYIEHQVAIKTKYRLWVAPAEHHAMARILTSC